MATLAIAMVSHGDGVSFLAVKGPLSAPRDSGGGSVDVSATWRVWVQGRRGLGIPGRVLSPRPSRAVAMGLSRICHVPRGPSVYVGPTYNTYGVHK